MCGICGFVSKENISLLQLKKMNDTMFHRGPDDSGEEIYPLKEGYAVGLAQRRLSILDLSQMGHQPMHSKDKRISVIYNGEIYNYLELKEELSDYLFCSQCDTEVIIAAYLKWGIECINKLNGMFAIALYDRETEEFYLIRDRIGKKPLYYQFEGENLFFASELKPLMERPGFSKEIKNEVLSRYLYQQYISEPNSVFQGVYKLEPGGILRLSFNRNRSNVKKTKTEVLEKGSNVTLEKWKYWDIKTVYHQMQEQPITNYGQAKEELKEILKKAVATRMNADVPLGAFLSGGYDSSLMTAMARETSKDPVKTFSIGFHQQSYNEATYAKEIADYLGTNHTECYISEEEMLKLVDSIPRYYDEPFADSSQIPTMLVSQLASKEVKVALSGDGGDEFFCGYNLYDKIQLAQKLDFIGGMTHGLYNLPGIRKLQLGDKLPFSVHVIAENRNKETKTQFGAINYITRANNMVLLEGIPCQYLESSYLVSDWQIRRMLLDMDTYLPGDILSKVDRASMKYSLEARCPILDRDVMEYSFRIAHHFKYDKGNKKKILKDIAYDYIPKKMLDRPKVGFGVPLDSWLRGPLKEELLDLSSRDYLKRQGLFQADYVADMMEDYVKTGDAGPASGANYSKLSWSFFMFQKWYQEYML